MPLRMFLERGLAVSNATLVVGLILALIIGVWVWGLIRKVGGCLIHLLLLLAGFILLVYILSSLSGRGL
jgi:hypothetical protein